MVLLGQLGGTGGGVTPGGLLGEGLRELLIGLSKAAKARRRIRGLGQDLTSR